MIIDSSEAEDDNDDDALSRSLPHTQEQEENKEFNHKRQEEKER